MMFEWLVIYAEKFGKEFPLRLFSGKREYEVLQLVMDCCNSGQPYPDPAEKPAEPAEEAAEKPAESEPKPVEKKRTTRKTK